MTHLTQPLHYSAHSSTALLSQTHSQIFFLKGVPRTRASLAAQMVKSLPSMQEPWVGSLGQEDLREGNGNPLQDSYLENPVDGEAWQATVHVVAKSWTRLSN